LPSRKLLIPVNGPKIREFRRMKGWSAQHLAEKIGLCASTIWDLERGRNKSSWHLEAIARALNVDPVELKRSSRNSGPRIQTLKGHKILITVEVIE